MPLSETCPLCAGRRHLRTAQGWRRCACASHLQVLPTLREEDAAYDPRFDALDPLPTQSLTYLGAYTNFRHHAWRSVLASPWLVYEAVTAYHLVDIHFARDAVYGGIRELALHDLVMVLLGIAELPHPYLAPCTVQLLHERRQLRKPTWVYCARSLTDIDTVYSADLGKVLRAGLVITELVETPACPAARPGTAATIPARHDGTASPVYRY